MLEYEEEDVDNDGDNDEEALDTTERGRPWGEDDRADRREDEDDAREGEVKEDEREETLPNDPRLLPSRDT